MTSCVAIAQLRPGRKIFNRQHLQEMAVRGRGGERERQTERGRASQRLEEDRRAFNPCKAALTDKRMETQERLCMQHKSCDWSALGCFVLPPKCF